MAVYKTKFCRIGYNPEITTSTDPENVCSGLGLNGNGDYTFPISVPRVLTNDSVYTRIYFISSSSILDTGYGDYDEREEVVEDRHGDKGAIEVRITGLTSSYGISTEKVRLSGQTPIKLVNHYRRINDIKVCTTGRLLKNQGDIYVTALDGVRQYNIIDINDFVSSGVPIATQYIYAKILAEEGKMLSSHYTVPRAHSLYINSIKLHTDVLQICNWSLKAGIQGALQIVYKGRIPNTFESQNEPALSFDAPYLFPAGTDINISIETVGGTVDVTSMIEGYLINQELLIIENKERKKLAAEILKKPELANITPVLSPEVIKEEEAYTEDTILDEQYSEIVTYNDGYEATEKVQREEKVISDKETLKEEQECETDYYWCSEIGRCQHKSDPCE